MRLVGEDIQRLAGNGPNGFAQRDVVEVAVGKFFPRLRIGIYFPELFERFRVAGPLF